MTGAAGMMPELGSKISLISKADIRYEGRLFTVDPQECTIALANVRSFGTEDRETPYPIAPQPTVYDYILFRGSDIKDIRVVNNVPIPNDPAIMQMHLPSQQQPQGFVPQQGGGFSLGPQPSGAIGQPFGPFVGMQGGMQPAPIGAPQSNQSQQPSQQAQTSPIQSQQNNQQDSRSGTPNLARKSPTSDMGVQTNQRDNNAGKDKTQRNNNQRYNNNNNNNNNRERRDSGRNVNQQRSNQPQQHQQHQQQQQQRGGYHNNNRNNNNNNNNQMRGNQHQHQQGGSGRMRVPQNQYYRNHNQNQNKPQNARGNQNKNTLKFENEFDFEQANSKFEELRSQLNKLKVNPEESKITEQVNTEVNGEVEKKDDSGNETGADTADTDPAAYDKNKSFFDNISCEALERSKGKPQRPDWRQERKINTETFGLSMNRRGNFSGRGRGYGYRNTYNNRPMNNYRSGGGQQQYRNRNRNNYHSNNNNSGRNNTNNNNQGQSQNQQPVAATN